ncbi:MAG: hypothetical protein AAF629_18645 [Chloroflexota bacterium]
MNKLTLVLSLMAFASISWLIYLATEGNLTAIIILSVLTSILLIGLGVAITLMASYISTQREQSSFLQNAKENLAILNQIQSVQNAQNSQLLKQVKQLPDPRQENALIIDDAIFNELE